MPYILRNIWEQVVSSDEQKYAAKEEAERRGLQWVSSSRVEHPTKPGRYLVNTYRMRFARIKHVPPVVVSPPSEQSIPEPEPSNERDFRQEYLRKQALRGKKPLVQVVGKQRRRWVPA